MKNKEIISCILRWKVSKENLSTAGSQVQNQTVLNFPETDHERDVNSLEVLILREIQQTILTTCG